MTAKCVFRMVWFCEAKQSAVTQKKASPSLVEKHLFSKSPRSI